MVLHPIPQCLPVHIFGSRPQPPTSHNMEHSTDWNMFSRFIYKSLINQDVFYKRYPKTRLLSMYVHNEYPKTRGLHALLHTNTQHTNAYLANTHVHEFYTHKSKQWMSKQNCYIHNTKHTAQQCVYLLQVYRKYEVCRKKYCECSNQIYEWIHPDCNTLQHYAISFCLTDTPLSQSALPSSSSSPANKLDPFNLLVSIPDTTVTLPAPTHTLLASTASAPPPPSAKQEGAEETSYETSVVFVSFHDTAEFRRGLPACAEM